MFTFFHENAYLFREIAYLIGENGCLFHENGYIIHECLPNSSEFFFNSLHARLNSHYKAWRYKKKKHKKINTCRKCLKEEPTVNKCLLIVDLKPSRL